MKNNWTRKTTAAVLVLLAVGGTVTVAATQGSQTDPLVTLSYLTSVLTPSILTQVDAKVTESRQAYLDKLNASITGYTTHMEELLGGLSGSAGQSSAAFSVVDLTQGQKLTGAVGCEIMLRVGTANCVSPASPGLIDSTDGTTLENGKALVKNHLYVATVADRGVTATAAVKLLVRGTYTIS
jgi:hypothetical protein